MHAIVPQLMRQAEKPITGTIQFRLLAEGDGAVSFLAEPGSALFRNRRQCGAQTGAALHTFCREPCRTFSHPAPST